MEKKNYYQEIESLIKKNKDENKRNYYINLCITRNLSKREFHNSTIGIIVSRYQDDFLVSFIKFQNIIPITYKLLS